MVLNLTQKNLQLVQYNFTSLQYLQASFTFTTSVIWAYYKVKKHFLLKVLITNRRQAARIVK